LGLRRDFAVLLWRRYRNRAAREARRKEIGGVGWVAGDGCFGVGGDGEVNLGYTPIAPRPRHCDAGPIAATWDELGFIPLEGTRGEKGLL
jgi:hypothetical protein